MANAAGASRGRPGMPGFEQRAAYIGDVHNADQAGVSHDPPITRAAVPAGHGQDCSTDLPLAVQQQCAATRPTYI